MQEGAPDIQVAMAAHEHQGGGGVDGHADGGDDDHRPGGDVLRDAKPADRLPDNGAHRQQQQPGIGEGGQDGALAQPIGSPSGRGSPGHDHGRPGHEQPQDVRQIVAGIGQQGQGAGHQAGDRLGRHKGDVQAGADGEGCAKILGRMAVTVMTVAVMAMVGRPVIMVVMVVIVIVGHGTGSSTSCCGVIPGRTPDQHSTRLTGMPAARPPSAVSL